MEPSILNLALFTFVQNQKFLFRAWKHIQNRNEVCGTILDYLNLPWKTIETF